MCFTEWVTTFYSRTFWTSGSMCVLEHILFVCVQEGASRRHKAFLKSLEGGRGGVSGKHPEEHARPRGWVTGIHLPVYSSAFAMYIYEANALTVSLSQTHITYSWWPPPLLLSPIARYLSCPSWLNICITDNICHHQSSALYWERMSKKIALMVRVQGFSMVRIALLIYRWDVG